MNIIGISANFHDASCCLLKDGKLVAAASEERFSRFKNDARIPIRSFRYCLEEVNLSICDVDCIAYYENPRKKLDRQLETPFDTSNKDEVLWVDAIKPLREIRDTLGFEGEIKSYDHHASHAAASFFFSGFRDAAILTSDGVGEYATTTFAQGNDTSIKLIEAINYPNSVGLFYSTITSYLGFKVLSGEYKVMGLAPYGKPKYIKKLEKFFDISTGPDFKLDMLYFDFSNTQCMYTQAVERLLEFPPRKGESEIKQHHCDLARSLQYLLETILLLQVQYLKKKVTSNHLCLSGGVALNCVGVHAIRTSGVFKELYIPPAPGDSGTALGAAALAYIDIHGTRHSYRKMSNAYLGPSYSNKTVKNLLDTLEIKSLDFSNNIEGLENALVDRLIRGKVVGFFHGRMEFGPRALGNRSIIADPRRAEMRDKLNALVKKREHFRPFAPVLLEEYAKEHIELHEACYFMSEICRVISKLNLPAITHVDGSCRPQTINQIRNKKFYSILKAFFVKTQCPILINTSFNVRGEPIVCSPLDAMRCFGNAGIEVLVLEDFIIDRENLTETFIEMAKHEHAYIKTPKDLFTRRVTEAVYTFI